MIIAQPSVLAHPVFDKPLVYIPVHAIVAVDTLTLEATW